MPNDADRFAVPFPSQVTLMSFAFALLVAIAGADASTSAAPLACSSAAFRIVDPQTIYELCNSGATGTTACGEEGGTCATPYIRTGQEIGFLPVCGEIGPTYNVDYGDGESEVYSSPYGITHVYATAGPKIVELAVDGTLSDLLCITVYAAGCPPIAGFSYSADACSVAFTNLSEHASAYLWNFGDGGTSTAEHPMHSYAAAGTYFVTLTAYNDECSPTEAGTSRSVTVGTAPGPPSLTSPSNGATSVAFSSGVAHAWSAGSGAPVTYDLRIYSGSGCGSLIQSYDYLPSPTYTVPAGAYASNTTYSWRVVPYGQCGGSRVPGTPSSCFEYTTGASCTSAPPPPSPLAPANGATNVSTTNVTFSWTAAGSGSSAAASYALRLFLGGCGGTLLASFEGIVATSYMVGSLPAGSVISWEVTAANACGTSAASGCSSLTTSLDEPPTASFVVREASGGAPVSGPLTQGRSYVFDGSSSVAGNGHVLTSSYWTFGDGWSEGGAIVDHVYTDAGTFDVSLRVWQDGGMNDLASEILSVVTPVPLAVDFEVSGTTCFGGTTELESRVAGGRAPYSYFWDLGDGSGTFTSANVSRLYSAPGVYLVQLSVLDADGQSNSMTHAVRISGDRPIVVTGLVTSRHSGTNIQNQWDDAATSTRPVDAYSVFRASSLLYRGTSPTGAFALRGTTPPDVRSHVDFLAWLPNSGREWYYLVTATNGCGNGADYPNPTAFVTDVDSFEPVRLPVRLVAGESIALSVVPAGPTASLREVPLLPTIRLVGPDRKEVVAYSSVESTCAWAGSCGGSCATLATRIPKNGKYWIEVQNGCALAAGRHLMLAVVLERKPPGR